jgi:hypothetical protein
MFISKAMRVFIVLYQEGSLKKAAERMNLTVPPVSRMLKMTEEWVGESLFVIDRNSALPTQAGKRIYSQLLPHYHELNNMMLTNHSGSSFKIASPQSNSSLMCDLLYDVINRVDFSLAIKDMESIHDDIDIFISFDNLPSPKYFEMSRVDCTLSLICPIELASTWKNKILLTEKAMTYQPGFKKALASLRIHGFTGHLHHVDNSTCLNHHFQNGDALIFKNVTTAQSKYHVLPVTYHQRLYIYTNTLKRSRRHDTFLLYIRDATDFNLLS